MNLQKDFNTSAASQSFSSCKIKIHSVFYWVPQWEGNVFGRKCHLRVNGSQKSTLVGAILLCCPPAGQIIMIIANDHWSYWPGSLIIREEESVAGIVSLPIWPLHLIGICSEISTMPPHQHIHTSSPPIYLPPHDKVPRLVGLVVESLGDSSHRRQPRRQNPRNHHYTWTLVVERENAKEVTFAWAVSQFKSFHAQFW